MLGPLFLLLSKFAFAVLKALKFHQHSRIGLIIIISFWKMPSGSFKDRIVLQFLIHYWLLLQNRNMICFYILFLCTETVLTFLILMIFLQIPCGFLNTMLYMNVHSFIYPLLMQLFHFLCNYFMQNFLFFLNRGDEISFRKTELAPLTGFQLWLLTPSLCLQKGLSCYMCYCIFLADYLFWQVIFVTTLKG